MPTLCGLRRRGYTAASIRNFCERIGVAKSPNTIEYGFLEHCLREDLNANAQRTMAVLHPVKLTVTNYPEGQSETFTVENNPTDPTQGTHEITFSRHLWIEADDFLEDLCPSTSACTPQRPRVPPEGRVPHHLHRLRQGRERPRDGGPVRVRPRQPGRRPRRRPQGQGCHPPLGGCRQLHGRRGAPVRQPVLRRHPDGPDKDFLDCLNPESLTVLRGCKVEPEMAAVAAAFDKKEGRTGVNAPTFQFMRVGYFCLDNRDSTAEHLVFNRSVSLKDSFKK